MTTIRRTLVISGVLGVLAGSAQAQEPQRRDGFWVGFGAGTGTASFTVDGYTVGDALEGSGVTFHLRLGGTPSERFLIGGELAGWAKSESGVTSAAANIAAVAYFYPARAGGAFLKAGFAFTGYAADDGFDELTSSGYGLVLGAGIDIRLGGNFSLTPVANVWVGGGGDLDVNDSPFAENWRHTIVELVVGLTIH